MAKKTKAPSTAAVKKKMASQMAANLGGNKIPATSTGKRVLCLHAGPANSSRIMHERFSTNEWQAVWVSENKDFKPDILAPLADFSAVPNNSFDAVWSPHTLQHLYAYEVPEALKEAYRVLKTDGVLCLFTPDLELVCDSISRKGIEKAVYLAKSGPVTGMDMLYGFNAHLKAGQKDSAPKTGFTGGYLGQLLRDAGFRDISINFRQQNMWAAGYKRTADTENNKMIKIMGEDTNMRMAKRDNLEKPPEKPVNVNFPFSVK